MPRIHKTLCHFAVGDTVYLTENAKDAWEVGEHATVTREGRTIPVGSGSSVWVDQPVVIVIGLVQWDLGVETNDPHDDEPGGGEVDMDGDADTLLDQSDRVVLRTSKSGSVVVIDGALVETDIPDLVASTNVVVPFESLRPGDRFRLSAHGDMWTRQTLGANLMVAGNLVHLDTDTLPRNIYKVL